MRDIEVFNLISNRLVEATMMHNELGDLFTYLGMKGFAKAQDYQFLSENHDMKLVNRYAICNLNCLIDNSNVRTNKYIPSEFKDVSRLEVNSMDKRDLIRSSIETWVSWETETKELYGNWYVELCNNHNIASAVFLDNLIKDVDDELSRASLILVELRSINFDSNSILLMQNSYYDLYCNMIKDKLKEIKRKEVIKC